MFALNNEETLPFVDYFCTCSTIKSRSSLSAASNTVTTASAGDQHITSAATSEETEASVTGRHLLSKEASSYLYPLSRLYFCEDCHQIRCPSCVQDEIISYYCPNCLFEVPTASVKSERNR
ncbi:dynactin p62 family-domain-containing protein [Mycotypha africana]|uniref:dynactin p62 family-domain-containing protein n=1 Tax=Mycotypha africana TaxID=64632 RepID=UPI00230172E2|nr:dynactin p62 family-domain-containing protein [Mycotypha africana]KAI8979680.1 dynactin p62 family-domain-containing protein [Mycotypha africana]